MNGKARRHLRGLGEPQGEDRFGLRFSYVDACRPEEVDKAMEASTRLVWIESPTNPMLRVTDIAADGKRFVGIRYVVDEDQERDVVVGILVVEYWFAEFEDD